MVHAARSACMLLTAQLSCTTSYASQLALSMPHPSTSPSPPPRYTEDPSYTPDIVAKQSRAAMSLCMWTRAMEVYNRWGAGAGADAS